MQSAKKVLEESCFVELQTKKTFSYKAKAAGVNSTRHYATAKRGLDHKKLEAEFDVKQVQDLLEACFALDRLDEHDGPVAFKGDWIQDLIWKTVRSK
eukprot:s1377_g3.t1